MPVSPHYNRSEILNFFDLSEVQKQNVLRQMDMEQAEEDGFVLFTGGNDIDPEPLPLSMFMRSNHSKIWDGIYGTSYFSAYFIKIARSGDMALVAERFC